MATDTTEVEVTNELVRNVLRAAVAAITRGQSDHGHHRLTIEFQDGDVRKAWVERSCGASELVTA